MENNIALDSFLKNAMSIDELVLTAPDPSIVISAREKVLARKKTEPATNDLFFIFAKFLDRRVKFQHAVIVAIFIGVSLLYFSKEEMIDNSDPVAVNYYTGLNSLPGSSSLMSIATYAIPT